MGAKSSHSLGVTTNCHVITVHNLCMSKELWFESQLILNDFDSAAIAGVDQLCEPSVLRLGERGEGGGERGRGRGRGGGLGRKLFRLS